MSEKISIGSVIKFGGAYIAYIIGSGFATGQEIVQFYTSYGMLSIAAVLISMFLFAWVGATVMRHGYESTVSGDNTGAYQKFCGKHLGTFYEYFVAFFLFCVVVIMLSGAGATLNEYYGLNHYVGSAAMAIVVYLAYVFGLKGLINIIGTIGPVIIVFTIGVGIISILNSTGDLSSANSIIASMEIPKASPQWWLSGLLYAAYNIFGSIIFLSELGKNAKSSKEASMGGAFGGITLMVGTLLMNVAFLANISEVGALEIPTLYLADRISPVIGVIFSVVLILGIFSTAAPMTWTVCDRITKEGTVKSKVVAAVVVILAFIGGQLPFGQLVGTIYPWTGYLGCLLFICLAVYEIKNRKSL
ncbi:hypothetical protein EXD82_02925 [Peptacetobacter hominis]|uniref:Transporter n=1 Tax=Peptacetobacter hominis TaxID=2743610 RepID=A0A544QWK0_9FIRM|nr:hypothetical protein [Peptacetobacter hominis]TQQ85065.1 hypothetical protein EXD82_02925 [Peptacetobacter hominis]